MLQGLKSYEDTRRTVSLFIRDCFYTKARPTAAINRTGRPHTDLSSLEAAFVFSLRVVFSGAGDISTGCISVKPLTRRQKVTAVRDTRGDSVSLLCRPRVGERQNRNG